MENTDIKYYKLEDILPICIFDGEKVVLVDKEADVKECSDISDDFDVKPNEKDQKTIEFVKRQQEVVKRVKKHFGYKCQICGETFLMDNGNYYCEAHHLVPLSLNGNQSPDNVIILCAKHHRMFHYAKEAANIKWEDTSSENRNIYIDGKKYSVQFLPSV